MKEMQGFLLVPGGHPSGWSLLSRIRDKDFILLQALQPALLPCSGTRPRAFKTQVVSASG